MKLEISVTKDEYGEIWYVEGLISGMTDYQLYKMSEYITNCPNEDLDFNEKVTYSDWLIKGFSTEYKFMIPHLKRDLREYYKQIKILAKL